MFTACGDDNSSSATDEVSSSSEETIFSSSEDEIESSSSEVQQAKNSSSSSQEANSSSETTISDSSFNSSESNSPISMDFGEGYTYAMAFRYDEATGIIYQGIESCNYHAGSKTFAWEENAQALDSNKVTIVGDSMWLGPVEKIIADDPEMQDFYDSYENRETLFLSSNHDGIYGKWTMTGCERVLGETEFKCTSSIGNMTGIARTITITTDSVYNTTVINLNSASKNDKLKLNKVLYNNLGFDIGNLDIDTLVENQVIKVFSDTAFSIGSQTFTMGGSAKFDKTGMNYYETFSSNGKTCIRHGQLGLITKEQCLEGNEDILLSDRGDVDDSYHYEEGPVEGFNLDNRDEYYECTKGLVSEETKSILAPFARQ